jgi:isoquinoline 1-oxidoreductase beta subunit
MRYAAIRHVPVLGARIVDFKLPAGVDADLVFTLGEDALVAVADNTWAAQRAVDAVEWRLSYPEESSGDDSVARARARLDEPGLPAIGQTVQAADDTDWDLEREYSVPLLAHAPLEPLACVAEWDGERMQVWASVQGPPRAMKSIVRALELPSDRVTVHQVSMGGSFGRRAQVDFTVQAAQIARRIGGAVKLTWARREEIQQDYFRPAYAARIEAQLDERGRFSRVRARIAGESTLTRLGYRMPPGKADVTTVSHLFQNGYAIPALERRFVRSPQPVRVGFWRSVASSMNAFFSETFVNEVARLQGVDPIDYRLELLADDARARRVLERVREISGWDSNDGLFRGVAFCMPYESYLAQVAEIEMLSDSGFRVRQVQTVVDCGLALDPVNVRSQIEGATVFGLTAAAYGEITLNDGAVEQQNFDTYRMARLAQTPAMETLVLNNEDPPGGAGELGVPAIAPALAAALHSATGRWPRDLPFTRSGFSIA